MIVPALSLLILPTPGGGLELTPALDLTEKRWWKNFSGGDGIIFGRGEENPLEGTGSNGGGLDALGGLGEEIFADIFTSRPITTI